MRPLKILITGASGLLGSALLKRLDSEQHSVICQSRFTHEDKPNVKWIMHDLINDFWDGEIVSEIDVVYHLAGQTSTYQARQNPIEDLSINVLGLITLLEHLKKQAHPPFVVIAGTATEVGLAKKLPINENLPDHPITFYDISKFTAELYLKQYIKEGWLTGCALRFANVYGRSKTGQQADRGIIDKVFNKAAKGEKITIYGDGSYLRDYIFIDDVVSALVMATEHTDQTNGRSFYIGSGRGISLKDAFLKVISLAGIVTGNYAHHEFVIPPADLSEIEYRNAIIDSSAFHQATGWVPQYDFDTGLAAAYHDILSRPS